MGDLRGLRLRPSAAQGHRPAQVTWQGARRWWIAGAAVGVAVLLMLTLARGPLGDRLWPQARVHELAAQGAQAMARGHLTNPDGSGARELYEAALAMDPDRIEPRAGLARVADAQALPMNTVTSVPATADRAYFKNMVVLDALF